MFHEGDVLRKWRDANAWTQEALAKRAGVDKNTITRLEKGEDSRTDTLRVVVVALGHTVEELHRALNQHGDLQPGEPDLLRRWRGLSLEAKEKLTAVIRLTEELEGAARARGARETESARSPLVVPPTGGHRKRTARSRGLR